MPKFTKIMLLQRKPMSKIKISDLKDSSFNTMEVINNNELKNISGGVQCLGETMTGAAAGAFAGVRVGIMGGAGGALFGGGVGAIVGGGIGAARCMLK